MHEPGIEPVVEGRLDVGRRRLAAFETRENNGLARNGIGSESFGLGLPLFAGHKVTSDLDSVRERWLRAGNLELLRKDLAELLARLGVMP